MIGIPHRLCQDDWYEGHYLPKNTLCIVNQWHLNHDTNVYGPDAFEFRPDRHLDNKGNLTSISPELKEEGHIQYGFGRRVCVGKHVANNTLFIQIASLLWAFKFLPKKDADGQEQMPNPDLFLDEGLVMWV
jgi:cytochrome P450